MKISKSKLGKISDAVIQEDLNALERLVVCTKLINVEMQDPGIQGTEASIEFELYRMHLYYAREALEKAKKIAKEE